VSVQVPADHSESERSERLSNKVLTRDYVNLSESIWQGVASSDAILLYYYGYYSGEGGGSVRWSTEKP
jgi:hypothetical protein